MKSLRKSTTIAYKKKRQLLQKLEKQHLKDLKRRPPIEIILKIMSYLDCPKDIRNCMLISKDTRDEIFTKQEYMRNYEFNLDGMLHDWQHGIEFLQEKGCFIKNFRYRLFIGSRSLMRLVLSQLPNLEELRFERKEKGSIKEKKAVVNVYDVDADDFIDGEVENEQNGVRDDEMDMKRKGSGQNGENGQNFGEICGENGEFGENGELGENDNKNSQIKKDSLPTQNGHHSTKLTTNNQPNPQHQDSINHSDLSDSNNEFCSDPDTEDDNDSDDESYKQSIHSSDDDDSSIGNESIDGEIEVYSDESSLEYSSDEEDLEVIKQPASLSMLKYLKINLEDLQEFVDNTKDVKSLEKLTLILSEFKNEEVLVNFLNNQENLKELELIKHKKLKELNLPKLENPNFTVKLKKIKIRLDCRNYEQLGNFMSSQVDCLEEADIGIGLYRVTTHFDHFLQNATKLTSLRLREGIMKHVIDLDDFRSPAVRYLDQKNYTCDLETLIACFPNAETVKCFSTSSAGSLFVNITSLELKIVDFRTFLFPELPNLKSFAITMNFQNIKESIWNVFANAYRSIENLSIQTYDSELNADYVETQKSLCILENLLLLPRLKNLNYKTTAMPKRISEFQCSDKDLELVRVVINVEKKIAIFSQFFVENRKETFVKLLNDFAGFNFYEVKTDQNKKVKIDPKMYLEVEEPESKKQKLANGEE